MSKHIYLISMGQTDEVGMFPVRAYESYEKAIKYKEQLEKEADQFTYYTVTAEILIEETE